MLFGCLAKGQNICRLTTDSLVNDEDYSVLKARDGNYYMAWFMENNGPPDIWIRRSRDGGFTWDSAWGAIAGPHSDWLPNLGQTADGNYHLVCFGAQTGTGIDDIRHSASASI